jgi:hypothetical protein
LILTNAHASAFASFNLALSLVNLIIDVATSSDCRVTVAGIEPLVRDTFALGEFSLSLQSGAESSTLSRLEP